MATRTFNIDPQTSAIEFAAVYATNSIIKGRFNDFSGALEIDEDAPGKSRFTIDAVATSVDTNNAGRDAQLRGPDFLDATSFDRLRFETSSVEVVDDRHWKMTGDLAIRGQSHPVTLDARYYGAVTDAFGDVRAGLVAETELRRSTWGLNWNRDQDGGVLISDAVRVNLYISAIQIEDLQAGEEADEASP